MSNRKKLRGARDGATRITPDKSMKGTFCGLYKLEAYDKKENAWNALEGCINLSWREAVTARTNYTALRKACNVANKSVLQIAVPNNEGNGN
mgnify:CR=1 FL=1|jgi:hypothetical protein